MDWKLEEEELDATFAANFQAVGTSIHSKDRLIGEFARNISAMIESL